MIWVKVIARRWGRVRWVLISILEVMELEKGEVGLGMNNSWKVVVDG